MPFVRILNDLLSTTGGALGAMFLDYEGETVACLPKPGVEMDDLKIIGAYQGIFLSQLKRLCTDIDGGAPDRFKVEFERATVLNCDLKDGYYVVLLLDPAANEGLAWRRLGECRNRLLAEM